MNAVGRSVFVLGVAIAIVGLLLWSGFGRGWFGRLPGDLRFHRGNVTFYVPIATCLFVSIVLTLISWIFRSRR